jgi:[FeFe] hydrogenase H-cluster maturation GTPase HydF
MGLNDTPSGDRTHIGFFGLRNAGKSSLVNAFTSQELSVVSDIKGTTTDPVQKSMELLPLGPVVIIDTPGYDDEGSLGEKRVHAAKRILNRTDIAVLVTDAASPLTHLEKELISIFEEKEIAYVIAENKSDLLEKIPSDDDRHIYVSAKNKTGIEKLKNKVASLMKNELLSTELLAGLVKKNETVILVTPIDDAAPKGRMILPEQMGIRDALDSDAICVVVKETNLKQALEQIPGVSLVVTDSQAFEIVSSLVPENIPLTSFSILMAKYKGFLEGAVEGVTAISELKDGDNVLISEGCTHHRQCEDIGTVKMPGWLTEASGAKLNFSWSSGRDFPEDLSKYRLVVHCGGCMLPSRELTYRMKCAHDQGVPFTNYGISIAYMHGILKRALSVFPELASKIKD